MRTNRHFISGPFTTKNFLAVAAATALSLPALSNGAITLTVNANQPGAKINPSMWGIFFEDINLGADGGLYAELVKNRSFEFTNHLMGWSKSNSGQWEIRHENPASTVNPNYLRLEGNAQISNEGFRGMGIHNGETYDFSTQARSDSARPPKLLVELISASGEKLGSTQVGGITSQWTERRGSFKAKGDDQKAHLNITAQGEGTVDLDMVSLFPKHTWKNRPGGLRADMAQKLADLKPGFLRFPGGCIVEGSQLDRRYQWKNTIGKPADRKFLINRWNYEFKHRPTPDYFQSFGLGFFEFFQLCEDIGAEPLPILNCGMACQFNTGQLVPLDQLDTYIQDDLDLIEFANGPVTSPWGAKRAAMGHPKPFNVRLLGVGNEQWGPQYIERYTRFAKAIKEKYPDVMLISDAGPSPADDRFDFLWPKMQELKADIVDQHCYANPIWFLANSHRYDDYSPSGPKIFMGEYAAQSIAIVSPDNKNDLECALSEAAYMTGLERDAAVVRMASYAPLFAHVEGWQWTPNLIWADNLHSYATPNYYVQQLYSLNRGDTVLPVKLEGVDQPTEPIGCIAIGTFQTAAEFKDVKVEHDGQTVFTSDFASGAQGWTTNQGNWTVQDGAYRQSSTNGNGYAFAGDTKWKDYTLTLKARKIAGNEGFLISVRQQGPENAVVWNLGGFRNRSHVLAYHLGEQDDFLAQNNGSIQRDRWYDVKIVVNGVKVDCYLDGQLVQSGEVRPITTQRIYASATRDEKAGELILKVVNPGNENASTEVNLDGISGIKSPSRAIILANSDQYAVNSFENPKNVAPTESKVNLSGPKFSYQFPRHSFTVLRVKTR